MITKKNKRAAQKAVKILKNVIFSQAYYGFGSVAI